MLDENTEELVWDIRQFEGPNVGEQTYIDAEHDRVIYQKAEN